ncbi:MAG TPA: hypothetical protein VD835_20520, partial [Pyrinomonadaceae bacterium]|nr:hypothetical protein [Pyrinomonadaceae bacterium]
MRVYENAHPEGQLGTGEAHEQSIGLTVTPYHALCGTASEFRIKRLADTADRVNFPRHPLSAAQKAEASTNLQPRYDIVRGDSTSTRRQQRRHTIWGQFDELSRYLATGLIRYLERTAGAAESLATSPDLLRAILGLNLGRNAETRLKRLLDLGLIRVINGRLDVLYDRDSVLG